MIYTGVLVPYSPELSRVSYDPTPLICENAGCGEYVLQPLVVPGEQIGRPGRNYRVIRCLNCIFWGPYLTYFDGDLPVRVEFDHKNAQCQQFLEKVKDDRKPNVVSLEWRPGEPDLEEEDWTHSVAGGEPDWLQGGCDMVCPTCATSMEFILQFSSDSIDPYFRAPELREAISLKIEHYATLYLFACEACNVTASLTECT